MAEHSHGGAADSATLVDGEDDFRDEALRFLDANARPRVEARPGWGEGSDRIGLFTERTPERELAEVQEAKAWRGKVFDAGFGWITGPARYGGRELPASYERLWRTLEAGYDVPSTARFGIGLGMIAPTILAHGTDVVKQRYLRSMFSGRIVACQLFSEPGAGSDLAGLQTRAERDGDEWVVNGQKVWTSGAQYSDIGEIICRSDASLPKHKGLTGFVVDMHATGVDVRPLRQMTGGASFNEVFFTDVRIADDHRLGPVNGGWGVALTTLMNERAAIGGGVVGAGVSGARLVELVRHMGRADDPTVRQRLAEVWINAYVGRLTVLRAMERVHAGQLPGPEMSITKLALANNLRRVTDLVSATLGPKLVADSGEWGTYAWAELVLGVPGFRIGGGTDEVMKNIIGERLLGLPKDPPMEARR
jgi:acyl-CoA dehydrogenase